MTVTCSRELYRKLCEVLCPYCRAQLPYSLSDGKFVHAIQGTRFTFACEAMKLREEVHIEDDRPKMIDTQALGADAALWAGAFHATALSLGYSRMDEGWLIGWFANAIETAHQVRTEVSRKELREWLAHAGVPKPASDIAVEMIR